MKIRKSRNVSKLGRAFAFVTFSCLLIGGAPLPGRSQSLGFERERARSILGTIKEDIKRNYYDPNFRGVDLDARFSKADEDLKKAESLSQMVSIIAQALLDFRDSHTFFIPPGRSYRAEYGWQMQMIGDRCHIVAVKPGSDAEAKGLKVGDVLLSLEGYKPTRDSVRILKYFYYALNPSQKLRLVVQSPRGQPRQLEVLAKIQEGKRLIRPDEIFAQIREAENEARQRRNIFHEIGGEALIWRMPEFSLPAEEVDVIMGKVRKHKALILDLRGNGGGSEETMLRILGHLFDRDVQIGEIKRRKGAQPLVAKTRGPGAFKGQLVVLVDSNSGSASELLARVVQLEKRGTVIGDRTAGAVMRSRVFGHKEGVEVVVYYGVSITDADVIMPDGKSLEGVGVMPDERMLPTAADLAAKRDPVLSYAAAQVGVKIDAEKAGAMFPHEWAK